MTNMFSSDIISPLYRALRRTRPGCLLAGLVLLLVFLGACTQTAEPNTAAPDVTFVPTLTPVPVRPTATPDPVSFTPTPEPNAAFNGITFSYGISLTTDVSFTEHSALPPGQETPFWEVAPEFVQVSFAGYPHPESAYQPHIAFYPVTSFAPDPAYADVFQSTRDLLLRRPAYVPGGIDILPQIATPNEAQIIQSHLQYLDFADGQGVRFLTEYADVAGLVNNNRLVYVFQGLTDDGQTYIGAIMPVASPLLPSDGQVVPSDPDAFISSFPAYLSNTEQQLNAASVQQFTPSLAELDKLFKSLRFAAPPSP